MERYSDGEAVTVRVGDSAMSVSKSCNVEKEAGCQPWVTWEESALAAAQQLLEALQGSTMNELELSVECINALAIRLGHLYVPDIRADADRHLSESVLPAGKAQV
ncbi:hypothetical protein NDU88_007676 [Pleurodeles waltl]|uniref:Uncharacterized protein n=1 Tax=Pleurodeles waltl TaxID=8319 RepID=A0AAV7NAW8_PLEWA|nr:hypothetical protein NDU88_007676 [Pleurodeles waltl]